MLAGTTPERTTVVKERADPVKETHVESQQNPDSKERVSKRTEKRKERERRKEFMVPTSKEVAPEEAIRRKEAAESVLVMLDCFSNGW